MKKREKANIEYILEQTLEEYIICKRSNSAEVCGANRHRIQLRNWRRTDMMSAENQKREAKNHPEKKRRERIY